MPCENALDIIYVDTMRTHIRDSVLKVEAPGAPLFDTEP